MNTESEAIIKEVDDPIYKEVTERFGPIVKTCDTHEELRNYFKQIVLAKGQQWTGD